MNTPIRACSLLLPLSIALLAACAGDEAGSDTGSGGADGGADAEVLPEVPVYTGGKCPSIDSGSNSDFLSADIEREFRVALPAQPEGAGVVVAWHWLGGSASQIMSYMDLQTIADDHGFIVVAPDSRSSEPYEWDFNSGPDDNADAILFDDLVACLHAQYNVDMGAIHATGMSAGGLWTTWLTVYRSTLLASTAPLSGGTSPGTYVSPEEPIPVLMTWGGSSDTYSGFSFEEASLDFSSNLQADGHFVAECEHDGGHTIPSEATDYVGQWFADHRRNIVSEPYADGLPEVFPEWCRVP
jgi:dienelactone hydrolase